MNDVTPPIKPTERDYTVLYVFYPAILTVCFVPIAVFTGYWWVGVVMCLVLLRLRKHWWTCVFGMFNVIFLIAGISACLLAHITILRDAVKAKVHTVGHSRM